MLQFIERPKGLFLYGTDIKKGGLNMTVASNGNVAATREERQG